MSEIRKILEGAPLKQTPRDQRQVNEILLSLGIEPGDLYQELEMEGRYVDTHRDVTDSNSIVNLHSHSYNELLYCRSCQGVEYLVGSQRYKLQPGDIILVPAGVSHRPLLPEAMEEPYSRDVIWASTEFTRLMEKLFPSEETIAYVDIQLLRTAGTRWEFLGELFRRGIREAEQCRPGWEAAVVSNTAYLTVQLYRAIREQRGLELKAEQPELLDRVMVYIEGNFSRHISLADTAKQFFVSESAISQLFRQKLGVSFYRFVTQRRLITAKTLIEEGMLLEDVARQVGFTDYSAFYRAFRQEYGISPRQYRKKA